MRFDLRSVRLATFLNRGMLAAIIAALITAPIWAADGSRSGEGNATGKPTKPARDPGAVEVRFNDNSSLKLTLRDEKIEVTTRYGKLAIPISDIQRIELGLRIPDDVARRVESLIGSLGSSQFRVREAASAELLELKEKAYPALLQAAKHMDMEISHRAEELIAKIRDSVPEDRLGTREFDIIYTEDSKIAGRITSPTLRVQTLQFGEQQLKLADVLSVRSLAAPEPEQEASRDVMPDPGNLKALEGQAGRTFSFRVTGAVNGSLWGTDLYTTDSTLAMAAVHAGVVQPGQTRVVKATILGPQQAFQGSTRNGVASSGYGAYPGSYRVHR
jgi:LCCL domain